MNDLSLLPAITKSRWRRILVKHRYRARKNGALGTLTLDEWQTRLRLAHFQCVFCGNGGPLTVEHIKPIWQGGGTTYENCVPACRSCNHARNQIAWYVYHHRHKFLVSRDLLPF